MRKEKDVKERVKEILNKMGAFWFMYVPTGYGVAGIPDFLVCFGGMFFGIECKFGKNKPTALQHVQLNAIVAAGGLSLVIDETNVESLERLIRHHWLSHQC